MLDYYELLGIPRFTASQDEIKKAYRKQIMYFHPDKGHVSEDIALAKTKELNEAYDVLSNVSKKAEYDDELSAFIKFGSQTDYDRAQKAYAAFNRNKPNYKYGQFYNSNYSHSASGTTNNTYAGNASSTQTPYQQQKKSSGNSGCLIWIIIIAIIGGIILFSDGGSSSSSSSSSNTHTSTTQNTQNYTPVSVYNGQIIKSPSSECVAPFEVKTTSGSNYYVYLDDVNGNNDISFYIVGGNTVEVLVPLGTYEFYYCSGQTWYGTKYKFGDNTSGAKADAKMKFYIDGDCYMGHTITLYAVSGGNMSTSYVNMNNFPN